MKQYPTVEQIYAVLTAASNDDIPNLAGKTKKELWELAKRIKAEAVEEKTLCAYIDYAKAVSENAVRAMEKGFIAPSPIGGTCEYCEYKAACRGASAASRKAGSVSDDTIEKAAESAAEEENARN